MSLYYEALQSVKDEIAISEVYRFQGGNSQKHICVEGEKISYPNNSYVYFSTTERHHKYFITKRLIQLIEDGILSNFKISLNNKSLSNSEIYGLINSTIPFNEGLQKNSSSTVYYYKSLFDLIKENMVVNHNKNIKLPEKTDRKTHGGGYGLEGPWLNLFNHITLAIGVKNINYYNILSFIAGLRRNSLNPQLYKKINAADFLFDIIPVTIINREIYDPFTKYEIMQELETILEQGLFLPTSSLATDPNGTKKRFIANYLEDRNKFVDCIDKTFSKKLEK